jgi:pSer/pThr/pTyr-binding forkhead associated (FHA) protein
LFVVDMVSFCVSDAEIEVGADQSSYAPRFMHQDCVGAEEAIASQTYVEVEFFGGRRYESIDSTDQSGELMPYIVLAEKDREIDRRELTGPMVLGRSPECDISVRDILLSRRHCALEQVGSYWVIVDLNSKNGTWLKGHRIAKHVLAEGEVLRMGKIQLCFRSGAFIPAPPGDPKPAGARPADPKEALAGTVAGFRFEDDENKLDKNVVEKFPRPKPRPTAPKSYASDQVYVMLADIASSSWDSALTDSARRRPSGELPKPILKEIPQPPEVPPAKIDLAARASDSAPVPEQAAAPATGLRAPSDAAAQKETSQSTVWILRAIAWIWAALILAGWWSHLPR